MRKSLLVPLLAVSIVLAGCIKIDMAIIVNDDGSGTLSLLTAFDQSLADGLGGELSDPLEGLDEADLPEGATVEPYDEDGFTGVRLTFPFAASDDVPATLEQAFGELSDDGNPVGGSSPFQDFVLAKQGDGGWLFEGSLDEEDAFSLDQGGDGEFGAEFAQLFLEQLEFTIRMQLPGEVVEHNADSVSADGELTWNIDPLNGPFVLTARTEEGGGGGTPWGLIIGSVVVIAVVVGGGLFLLNRTSQPSAPAG